MHKSKCSFDWQVNFIEQAGWYWIEQNPAFSQSRALSNLLSLSWAMNGPTTTWPVGSLLLLFRSPLPLSPRLRSTSILCFYCRDRRGQALIRLLNPPIMYKYGVLLCRRRSHVCIYSWRSHIISNRQTAYLSSKSLPVTCDRTYSLHLSAVST